MTKAIKLDLSVEELRDIYNICKKRLFVTEEEFVNSPDYVELRNSTIKQYKIFSDFLNLTDGTRDSYKFRNNVIECFGPENFSSENIFAFFFDRGKEFNRYYPAGSLDNFFDYCLLNREDRMKKIEARKIELYREKKSILEQLYDYLLADSDIDREKFLNFNNHLFDDERDALLTINSNMDMLTSFFSKIDSKTYNRIFNEVKKSCSSDVVRGKDLALYLFNCFRNVIKLKQTFGYDKLHADEIIDIIRSSLHADKINSACGYTGFNDAGDIIAAYNTLSYESVDGSLYGIGDKSDGLTVNSICLLGKDLDKLKALNSYKGFFDKVEFHQYVLMTDDEKKDFVILTLFSYRKKILKGSSKKKEEFFSSISGFGNLSFTDRNRILKNANEYINELFDIIVFAIASSDDVGVDVFDIDQLIGSIGQRYLQAFMIERQDYVIEDMSAFCVNPPSELIDVANHYNDFIASKINLGDKRVSDDSLSSFADKDLFMLGELLQSKLESDDIINREVYVEWYNGILNRLREEYPLNYEDLFNAFAECVKLYEIKNNKKYDPSLGLIDYDGVVDYYNSSDNDRVLFFNQEAISGGYK